MKKAARARLMNVIHKDRRAFPRLPFPAKTVIDARGRQIGCRGVNFSLGGMLVHPPARAEAGLSLRIHLKFPGLNDWVSVKGKLLRETRHAGDYAWAIHFQTVAPHVLTLMKSYVQKHADVAATSPEAEFSSPRRREYIPHRRPNAGADPLPSTPRPQMNGPLPHIIANIPQPAPLDPEPITATPQRSALPAERWALPKPQPVLAGPEDDSGSGLFNDPFAGLAKAIRSSSQPLADVRQGNPLSDADSGLQRFLDDTTEGRGKALETLFRDAIKDLQPKEEKGESKKKRWFR